jgi:hypothetical protein
VETYFDILLAGFSTDLSNDEPDILRIVKVSNGEGMLQKTILLELSMFVFTTVESTGFSVVLPDPPQLIRETVVMNTAMFLTILFIL